MCSVSSARAVGREGNELPVDLEALGDLVDPPLDLVVKDERDEDVLDLLGRDSELLQVSGA